VRHLASGLPLFMEQSSDQIVNFAANLRLLCERQGSISAVCRKINLNRQQFNKYLSGLHMPSSQNLRQIANFFGLSVPILFTDHAEFRTLVEGNFFHAMETVRSSPELNRFIESMIVEASADHKDILGVYDRYQYSSIYKGFVLRSALCIYKNREFLQHYYIERFPSHDDPTKTEYVFKYYGFVFPVAGRLFTVDFEGIQNNEMTFGVFAPVKRSSNTMFRQPYSTKVALHYRGPGLIKREHLDKLTVLDRGDPSIPREAMQFLGDASEMIHLG
jgi:transcriptional regulator with XRE-family HTH domain